jgi:DNA-binding CsgD family transcriptional regulator
MLLGEVGVIQVSSGNLSEATPALVESVARSWKARYDDMLTRALRGLAAVAAATDQPLASAHLLGAADAIDATTPFARTVAARDRDIVDWTLARLDEHLAAAALARARQTGAGLSIEQAVALAREVATSVLGAARVDEIWQATNAPEPGPVPLLQPADLHPVTTPTVANGAAVAAELASPTDPAGPAGHLEPAFAFGLTRREREVLALLCQRWTDPEIAARLFISPKTVSRHVANIFNKLGVSSRRDAAAHAAAHGLV